MSWHYPARDYLSLVDADYSGQYDSSAMVDAVANMYQLLASP